MPKTIQLRYVPDAVHRRLKEQAATEGLSLSDYLLRELHNVAERPTLAELEKRLARLSTVNLRISSANAVRAERDRR